MKIVSKEKCCGCWACYSVCPVGCIEMVYDAEGFLYSVIDEEKCTNCGLCGKVCPGKGALKPSVNQKVSLAYSKNKKVIEKSASGGMFYPLAKNIITKGGAVFGARLQGDFKVVHFHTDCIEKVPEFMGSKYVQSEIGECYKRAKEFLEAGRWVLFTGVPCQILGLRKYLGKEYKKLVAVNLICNSVPSPLVFRVFIQNDCEQLGLKGVRYVNMRCRNAEGKSLDLGFYNEVPALGDKAEPVYRAELYKTAFGRGFGSGIFARPSCSNCVAKGFRSGSDITIGDFWGAEEWFAGVDARCGASVVIVETEAGQQLFNEISESLVIQAATLEQALQKNPMLVGSIQVDTARRAKFWQEFKTNPSAMVIEKHTKVGWLRRVRGMVGRLVRGVHWVLMKKIR